MSEPTEYECFGILDKVDSSEHEHWIFGAKTNSASNALAQLQSEVGVEFIIADEVQEYVTSSDIEQFF